MSRLCTEEQFLKDVAQHEMTILMDNGIYRHLRFKRPGSTNLWFEIVTWPGFLAYVGDMGAYTFTRLTDMFQFFRERGEGGLRINPNYWSEKLEAVDRNGRDGGYKEYSQDKFRERIEEIVQIWLADIDGPYDGDEEDEAKAKVEFGMAIREAIESDIEPFIEDGQSRAYEAVRDFSFEYSGHKYASHKYEFHDAWEWDTTEFTFRFLWCCYALAWAIRKYDAAKTEQQVAA